MLLWPWCGVVWDLWSLSNVCSNRATVVNIILTICQQPLRQACGLFLGWRESLFFFFFFSPSFRCIKLRVKVKAEMCVHIILVRFRSVCMVF